MKNLLRLAFISMALLVVAGMASAYTSGPIQAEDGITSNCNSFSPCSDWVSYQGIGNEQCNVGTYCWVQNTGYFEINDTPASVPSGASCNITVRLDDLTGSNEGLQVSVNGANAQTVSNPGTGNITYTYPSEVPFTGGSDGSDLITFTSAGTNQIHIDWYSLQCTDGPVSAVPEFSYPTVIIALAIAGLGIFLLRRRK
jgi:hypothetical protein